MFSFVLKLKLLIANMHIRKGTSSYCFTKLFESWINK